jgi:putative transposase
MPRTEIELRREAVRRVLWGEPPAKVAADFGRTDRWVRKWVARYDPNDEGWAEDDSRAPHSSPTRTPEGTRRIVLKIRERLMEDPWAQVGAVAIAWELQKLGFEHPPETWTIERILREAGAPKRRTRTPYVPKGTPYPAGPVLVRPNAVHQIDLVGPRHLEGAVPFYALNAVDVGRRRCGIEVLTSKEEREVAAGLLALWSRLGVPSVAQFDNGQTIAGRHRHLALPARACLHMGIRPRFIPFGEPWRNGVVEHFNDIFDKRFFRTERFKDLAHLARRAAEFEAFHNAHHRYSALKGATPQEWERRIGFVPTLLAVGTEVPTELPRRGVVEFVRLVRSDRVVRILGVKLAVPEELVHRYVTAKLYLRARRIVLEREATRLETSFILSRDAERCPAGWESSWNGTMSCCV